MTVTQMPRLGLGTYGRRGDDGVAAIRTALAVGYRHIDTAQSYHTEVEVGEALRQSGIPRDEVFITSKIDIPNYGKGRLIPSLHQSLRNIGVDQVDLTLIHWPSPRNEVPLRTYLTQIAEAQDKGLTRLIGVSNFPIALLQETDRILGSGRIATNQVELNPLFQNRKLAGYCAGQGLLITCYQPIAKGRVARDSDLKRIAAAHGATPEQVALAWELACGHAAIPASSDAGRIASNFGALAVSLTPEDMASIATIPDGPRAINPADGPAWD
jgi:2,5-diketo-D-gluconate reductase B